MRAAAAIEKRCRGDTRADCRTFVTVENKREVMLMTGVPLDRFKLSSTMAPGIAHEVFVRGPSQRLRHCLGLCRF